MGRRATDKTVASFSRILLPRAVAVLPASVLMTDWRCRLLRYPAIMRVVRTATPQAPLVLAN